LLLELSRVAATPPSRRRKQEAGDENSISGVGGLLHAEMEKGWRGEGEGDDELGGGWGRG